jgi:hypothetical protein
MDISIGRCGLACEVCKHFNQDCQGCEKENRLKHACLVFNCAEEKNTRYCLQCMEFPCNLMRGLSKSYCPVYSQIKLN